MSPSSDGLKIVYIFLASRGAFTYSVTRVGKGFWNGNVRLQAAEFTCSVHSEVFINRNSAIKWTNNDPNCDCASCRTSNPGLVLDLYD